MRINRKPNQSRQPTPGDRAHVCQPPSARRGWLTDNYAYRLPTIREWVMAVCPASLSVGSATESKYPWGNQWPPWGIANLHPSLKVDSYRFTSPVGSFPANQFGLYDISGNASQWCEYDDPISKRPDRPRRGGSFAHSEAWMLLCADSASSASGSSAAEQGQLALGFRIVLGGEHR